MKPVIIRICLQSRAGGIISRKKFPGRKRTFYEGVDRVAIIHPFGAASPKLMESDGRAGSILDFRQIRHSEPLSTTIMLVRAMIVIALVIVMVKVRVRRGRERVSECAPRLLASSHFVIGKQATIELRLQGVPTHVHCHDRERLPPVAEWLLPFVPSPRRHL